MNVTAVSVAEYLHTDYSPDVDYVDGELEERNVGGWDHARLQSLIERYLGSREKEWGVLVVPEQRVQIATTRFRVPDITVVARRPASGIVTEPPLLCIEILSPEDTHNRLRHRIEDYLRFGVPSVWVIDPRERRGWIWTSDGMREAKDGVLTAGEIRLPLAALGE
jgi:Uma2 family endonuclease